MSAIVQSRWECMNILENFEKEYKAQMYEINFFGIYVRLQTYLSKLLKSYRDYSIGFMSYNPDDETDPKN